MTQLTISRKKNIQGRIVGQAPLSLPLSLPAPIGGWNAVDSLTTTPPEDANTLYNMISRQAGVVVRPGYVNQGINIGGGITTEIRTVVGFNDVTRDDTTPTDRLFAFTDQGIYDITNGADNPTLMVIYSGLNSITPVVPSGWNVKGGNAGWVSYTHFTNSLAEGGKHYLCICDTVNGYHVYDPNGGGANVGRWYKILLGNSATEFGPVDPTLLIDVQQWKGRLFFTERNSSRMWYLTPGTITGGTTVTDATAVDVGARFQHGGYLKGVWTWTYNGGAGFDDFLVAVSSAGDVVVWEGTSPTAVDWIIKGVWYIGEVPYGRQIASQFNGDLFLIGALGIVPMSRLVSGGSDESPDKYITHKVQNLVRNFFRVQARGFGWGLTYHPSYGLVVLNAPVNNFGQHFQLVLSTQANSWSVFEGINALAWESWHGKEYVGLDDGRVVLLSGNEDTKQSAEDTFVMTAIEWSVLTAYRSFENPAAWKRVHYVRPLFLASQTPSFEVAARYDFELDAPLNVSPPVQTAGYKWDTAEWDIALWEGAYVTEQPVHGTTGMGRWVAISLVGRSVVETSLVGFDLVGDMGGLL